MPLLGGAEGVHGGTGQSVASGVFCADNCRERAKISKPKKRGFHAISSALHTDEELS